MGQANLFIDTETTGFSPRKHEIIELAAAIEIDGITQCEFVLYFRPERWENISKEALAVNGWTVERLKRLPDRKSQNRLFKSFIASINRKIIDSDSKAKKMTIVEHSKNGNFDVEFLKSLILGWGSNYPPFKFFFNSKPINTRDLAKRKFPGEKNLSLKDCARLLGIPFDDKRHHKEALYDMQICREIYRRCR